MQDYNTKIPKETLEILKEKALEDETRKLFGEIYSFDIKEYVEQKQGLSYLSWAYAWREFKQVYPTATYSIKKDENGKCYFGNEDIGYMVYTSVTAGGLEYEMWLPVMDGANKSMKLKPYEYQTKYGKKNVEAISTFDINKAIMRCLTKNLAMFGLGLYIYAGEDLPEDIRTFFCEECGCEITPDIAQRTKKAFNQELCVNCGIARKGKENEQNK